MYKQVQRHATLIYVTECAGGDLFSMKILVDFFDNRAPIISNLKALTVEETPVVIRYAREVYLAIVLILSCDHIIYRKLVKDMGNKHTTGKYSYPHTLQDMQNILARWQHITQTTSRLPTGGIYFYQERPNYEGNDLTNNDEGGDVQSVRQRRDHYISIIKYYNCKRYGHYLSDFPDRDLEEGEGGACKPRNLIRRKRHHRQK